MRKIIRQPGELTPKESCFDEVLARTNDRLSIQAKSERIPLTVFRYWPHFLIIFKFLKIEFFKNLISLTLTHFISEN